MDSECNHAARSCVSSGLRACPIALSGLAALGFLIILAVQWMSQHVETVKSTISETALASVTLYHLTSATHGTGSTEAHGSAAGMAALQKETKNLKALLQRLSVYFGGGASTEFDLSQASLEDMAYRSGVIALPGELKQIWTGTGDGDSVLELVKYQVGKCMLICTSPDMSPEDRSKHLAALNTAVVDDLLPRLRQLRAGAADWQRRLQSLSRLVVIGALACIIASILFTRFRVVQPLLRELGAANANLAVKNDRLEQQVALRTEHLKEARDRAEAAHEARTRFLASINHEMRTPLNGVLGVAALLRSTRLDRQQSALVETIQSSGKILVRLIDDVLDYVSLSAGKMKLIASSARIEGVLQESLDLLRPVAEAKGLFLKFRSDGELDVMAEVDPHRLQQIINNIVGNAIKFTTRGGISVHLDQRVVGKVIETQISVEDSGVGIPAEKLCRIFEPFDRAALGVPTDGAGLGLAVTKSLVEEMSGRLSVESEPDCGSRFTVTVDLPLSVDAPDDAAQAA